jgi:hypothetical protein
MSAAKNRRSFPRLRHGIVRASRQQAATNFGGHAMKRMAAVVASKREL